jgi:hypothetical protein
VIDIQSETGKRAIPHLRGPVANSPEAAPGFSVHAGVSCKAPQRKTFARVGELDEAIQRAEKTVSWGLLTTMKKLDEYKPGSDI